MKRDTSLTSLNSLRERSIGYPRKEDEPYFKSIPNYLKKHRRDQEAFRNIQKFQIHQVTDFSRSGKRQYNHQGGMDRFNNFIMYEDSVQEHELSI